MLGSEHERIRSAASRLRAFFSELQASFVEREDLLFQAGLALLSREHVLITGPPGTAKSRLTWAVLGRILDEQSGEPSLYARQFTESTVQTDLVGPLDFKTLMETGRTEHFTDEGMLGAVHAFLDEVFDGRDMLLRSTLNVLHERELKQGTKTTRGRIECAFLTTNRYLAEVLEGSREALLAFVDRIAHVSFVPKGFGDPASLRRLLEFELAGKRRPKLTALLTLQDLDALQEAVESIRFAPGLGEVLADFVRRYEAEIAAAVRADPTFVPTRYLSTRTVLRLATTLRAAVVLDWAMTGQTRRLRVEREDFAALRYTLTLCGPRQEALEALFANEVDPRERRQLEILRTERAAFERCLGQLPEPNPKQASDQDPAALSASGDDVIRASSTDQLLAAARRLMAADNAGSLEPDVVTERLGAVIGEIRRRAIEAGLDATLSSDLTLLGAAERIAGLADDIEPLDPGAAGHVRWLRGRALELVQQAIRLSPVTSGDNLRHALEQVPTLDVAKRASDERLGRLEGLLEIQTRLVAQGAEAQQPRAMHESWQTAVERVQDDLLPLWDQALRVNLERVLRRTPIDNLPRVLEALRPARAALGEVSERLERLGAAEPGLAVRVLGARLGPLVKASCERVADTGRPAVWTRVEALFEALAQHELTSVIPAPDLLGWVATLLLGTEPSWETLRGTCSNDFAGYRALRNAGERRSVLYTLAELGARLAPAPKTGATDLMEPIRNLLSELPPPVRLRIASCERLRIEALAGLLEGWWEELAATATGTTEQRLAALSRSRFFHVTRDEAVLARLVLELKLLEQLLPPADVSSLGRRIDELERRSNALIAELLGDRADQAWRATLGTPDS